MNINRVVITANLTRDPELKQTGSGMQVCRMRVACNDRVKRNEEWQDKPNYVTVTVFGAIAENCNRFLSKGSAVAIEGRLDWQEWEKDGVKREALQVVANTVQFLDPAGNGGGSSGGAGASAGGSAPPVSAPPVSAPPVSAPADDDIPF